MFHRRILFTMRDENSEHPDDIIRVGSGPYSEWVIPVHPEWRNGIDLPFGVMVDFEEPPRLGMCFEYRGELWELAWLLRLTWGARPAEVPDGGRVQ